MYALRRIILESDLILKIFKSLLKIWEPKCDVIQKGNNFETLSYVEQKRKHLAYEKSYMKDLNGGRRKRRNISLKALHHLKMMKKKK